jgi:hypothetical protein
VPTNPPSGVSRVDFPALTARPESAPRGRLCRPHATQLPPPPAPLWPSSPPAANQPPPATSMPPGSPCARLPRGRRRSKPRYIFSGPASAAPTDRGAMAAAGRARRAAPARHLTRNPCLATGRQAPAAPQGGEPTASNPGTTPPRGGHAPGSEPPPPAAAALVKSAAPARVGLDLEPTVQGRSPSEPIRRFRVGCAHRCCLSRRPQLTMLV